MGMIARKKKTCKGCGKEVYIFSKGMCKYCAYKLKKEKTPSMKQFFDDIWLSRPPISLISGKTLSSFRYNPSLKYSCCAHVLSRKQFPHYALRDDNVVLITPEEHFMLDNGTEAQREEYSRVSGANWALIEEIKERLYNEYKNEFNK
jgi:ribosomal protein L37E